MLDNNTMTQLRDMVEEAQPLMEATVETVRELTELVSAMNRLPVRTNHLMHAVELVKREINELHRAHKRIMTGDLADKFPSDHKRGTGSAIQEFNEHGWTVPQVKLLSNTVNVRYIS